MIAIATAGGGPEASSRVPAVLGSEPAAGEGTGSAFFGGKQDRQDGGGGGGCLGRHIIHPIAIRKRRPAPEARREAGQSFRRSGAPSGRALRGQGGASADCRGRTPWHGH